MASLKIRFLMVAVFLSTFALIPIAATGAIVDSGSISGDGVISGGFWETGVNVGWSVDDTGSGYQYSYVFNAPDPGLSHFELQVSGNFTRENIIEISTADYELGTYPNLNGNSNPGWPEGETLYGIKFEEFTGGEEVNGILEWTFSLLSDRAPMDGDFYAKGGSGSFAYNSGFGALDGANILVPDTESPPIPEPGTMLLLGGCLIGIAGWGRKRFHQ